MANVTLREYLGEDLTGEPMYADPVTVPSVFGEAYKAHNSSGTEFTSSDQMRLYFFDLRGYKDWWGINRNEQYPQDEITYNGHTMTAVSCWEAEDHMAPGTVHHLEVICQR